MRLLGDKAKVKINKLENTHRKHQEENSMGTIRWGKKSFLKSSTEITSYSQAKE